MKEYEFNLGVFIFRDDDTNCYVAYCPSLELAGYADDEEGAKADFEFVFNEYLSYCDENGTLEEDLRRHGWEVKNNPQEPSFAQLLNSSKTLNKLCSTGRDFRKTTVRKRLTYKAYA